MSQQDVNWNELLQHAVMSDIGMRRSNNQDSYAITLAEDEQAWHSRGHLFIVADGMGAHAAGELASKMAVDGISHNYLKYPELSPPEAIQKAVLETNSEIHRRGQANLDFHNMGTTCSTLVLLPQGALAAHVGDSRIYRLRGGCLEQLTFDHSLVWEMRAAGQLPADSDLAAAVPKNVITRSLGPRATTQVDIEGPFPIQRGDTFLLCSDGLTGKVEDEEIGPLLASLPPEEVVQVLVDLANLRGGPDNITVVVAKVVDDRLASAAATDKPITLGIDKKTVPIHPMLWVVMAASFLTGVGLAILENWIIAALAIVGGLICLGVIFYQKQGRKPKGVTLDQHHRLGKGPHTRLVCPAGSSFVEKLSDIVARLRDMAAGDRWNLDLQAFDELCSQAAKAAQANRHNEAVRQYARGICVLMEQVRSQRAKNADDSAIDFG